jgi:hypothetical protein
MKPQNIKFILLAVLILSGCSKTKLSFNDQNSESSQAGAVNPFSCKSDLAPTPTETRRLTKLELSNTLKTLFGDAVFSQLSGELNQLPEVGMVKGPEEFINSFSESQIDNLMSLSRKAADVVTSSDVYMNPIVGCSQASITSLCASRFISNFVKKVFRRPLTSEEATWFQQIFAASANPLEGIGNIISIALLSPEFLYLLELGSAAGTDTVFTVTQYELASRLSYQLWDNMPDQELFTLADQNRLSLSDVLSSQIDRMINSPLAKTKIRRFFSFWLLYAKNNYQPSANPLFLNGINTTGLTTEMVRELEEYIDYVVWQKRGTYQDLLTLKDSFAKTPALAQIYQHPLSSGPQTLGGSRKGLLMRLPFLISGEAVNHPIVRGVFIRKRVLCGELGVPSAVQLTTAPETDSLPYIQQYTLRERTTIKTSGAACISCHAQINPLGFAFENFDSLGRERSIETAYDSNSQVIAQHQVNTQVTDLNLGSRAPASVNSSSELVDAIADSEKGAACFSRQVFRFYNTRNESDTDGCALSGTFTSARDPNQGILESIKSNLLKSQINLKAVKEQ